MVLKTGDHERLNPELRIPTIHVEEHTFHDEMLRSPHSSPTPTHGQATVLHLHTVNHLFVHKLNGFVSKFQTHSKIQNISER
jgi:hypothetical protein